MKRTISLILFFFIFTTLFAQQTEIIYLSGRDADTPVNWDFMVTKGMKANKWATIPVPSNWELQGFGAYNYGHDENKSDEIGFYKYRFEIPESSADKKISIVFEGVMTDTEVKINGKIAGPVHQGGFYRFEYDISDLVFFDKQNLLEVKVKKVSDNKSVEIAERNADYWVFGGIYRPVYLKIEPGQHIVRTAVNAQADGFFSVDIYYENVGKGTVIELQILQMDGQKLGRLFSKKTDIKTGHLVLETRVTGQENWTAESPNLYYVDITLKNKGKILHTVRKRFGFRTIEVREGEGIFLNGKRITLKGTNRHSFWPTTGRAISRNKCYDDVMLIKEMNMNAVRMSHYPPDTYFLDLCDEYGLYVLDEVAGWQKPSYDTPTSRRLIRQTVFRDVNHPSVVFWDNGNEGGWNTETDGDFAKYDLQKRNVLHPWTLFGGVDTDHYEDYASVQKKMQGENIFMPTEHLHGMYDGGQGAGLDDFWKLMWGNKLNGGMLLWDFADEGVVRTDKNRIIDTDINHAPDGIIGPFHEKEGSFYTVKEIWSPVYIETLNQFPDNFNGLIPLENRYDFTSLNQCTFNWELIGYSKPGDENSRNTTLAAGSFQGPDIVARSKGILKIALPESVRKSDAFVLTAFDPFGKEIYTWKWKLRKNESITSQIVKNGNTVPVVEKDNDLIRVNTGSFVFSFGKKDGLLKSVKNGGHSIPFDNGPVFVKSEKQAVPNKKKLKIKVVKNAENSVLEIENHKDFDMLKWTVYGSGWLKLEYAYSAYGPVDYMGVSFDYPEENIYRKKWLGKGPYRVWKNRLKGVTIDVWEENYRNFKVNTKWDYPEFTGYFADFSWIVLDTADGFITMLTDNEDLYLRLFSQEDGEKPRYNKMIWPEGDLSFLHAIPAIGTKFQKAESLGPQSRKTNASGSYSGTLYFYFGLPD